MKFRVICGGTEEDLLPSTRRDHAATANYNYFSSGARPGVCTNQKCLKIHLDEVIFTASCLATLMVLQLPMTNASGKPVPVFVFGNAPTAFHAFLVCLSGACFGSVCSIHIRKTNNNPNIARFYYAFAVISTFASFAIAFSCFVWEMFKASSAGLGLDNIIAPA